MFSVVFHHVRVQLPLAQHVSRENPLNQENDVTRSRSPVTGLADHCTWAGLHGIYSVISHGIIPLTL
jgi:hypothetical protein